MIIEKDSIIIKTKIRQARLRLKIQKINKRNFIN